MTFFWIDDVWVTGYLAQHLGIEHQDCIQHWTMKRDQLLLHKVDISTLDISTHYIYTRYIYTRNIYTRYICTRYIYTRYIYTG